MREGEAGQFMKSSVKKTLALVISLTMIATTFPMTALAAGQGSDKITKGENSGTIVNQEDPFDFTTEKGARKVLKKEEGLPDAFDQRNVGGKSYVTPVKLQNPFGSCWGFAAIGAAETSILGAGLKGKDEEGNEITYVDRSRKGDDKYTKAMDLSEKHLAYFAAMPLDMPGFAQDGEGTHHSSSVTSSDIMNFGGNLVLATNTFATGMGPNLEEIYSYDNEDNKVPDNSLAYRGKEGIIDQRYFKSKLYTKAGYHPFCYSAEDDWSLDKDDRFLQSFILKQSYILPNPAGSASSGGYEYNPAGTAAIKEQLYAKRGVEIGFCADTSSPNQEAGEDGVYISTKNAAVTIKIK